MLLLGSDLSDVPLTLGVMGVAVVDVGGVAVWHWAQGSSLRATTARNLSAGPNFILSIPVRCSSVNSGRPAPSILCSRKFYKEKQYCKSPL